jgi:phage FluMu protein Com
MKILQKGSKLYSILKLKCPRCQVGNLFSNPGLFVFSRILEMPNKCPHCKQNFKLEPGYYTAALWISYPIVLIIFIPLIILGFSLNKINSFFKFLYPLIIVFSFMLQIPLMRIARAILLNMSIDFTTKW